MKKIILAILIMIFSILNVFAKGAITPEDVKNPAKAMQKIDFDHSVTQFQSLLETIQRYYPEISIEDIGYKITLMWGSNLQPKLPNLSLYNFTEEVKNFLRDSGKKFNGFDEALAFYTTSKLYGY